MRALIFMCFFQYIYTHNTQIKRPFVTHHITPNPINKPTDPQNPSLRAKNPDLYTLAEKATLRHLVEVMLGCGVSYVQTAQQQQQGFGAWLDGCSRLRAYTKTTRPLIPILPHHITTRTTQPHRRAAATAAAHAPGDGACARPTRPLWPRRAAAATTRSAVQGDGAFVCRGFWVSGDICTAIYPLPAGEPPTYIIIPHPTVMNANQAGAAAAPDDALPPQLRQAGGHAGGQARGHEARGAAQGMYMYVGVWVCVCMCDAID